MMIIDYANKYWLASDGRVYASARDVIVTSTDTAYEADIATRTPLTWPSDANGQQSNATLYALLQPFGFGKALAPAPSAADLVAYAEAKQVALRDGGITVNVGTASTPDEVNVASDVNGRSLVSGSVQLIGLASSGGQPAPTFNWINDGGAQLTLTSTQMMTIGLKLGNFVQATYTALGTVLAAIADGTLTSTAAIDAAAWPVKSY